MSTVVLPLTIVPTCISGTMYGISREEPDVRRRVEPCAAHDRRRLAADEHCRAHTDGDRRAERQWRRGLRNAGRGVGDDVDGALSRDLIAEHDGWSAHAQFSLMSDPLISTIPPPPSTLTPDEPETLTLPCAWMVTSAPLLIEMSSLSVCSVTLPLQ